MTNSAQILASWLHGRPQNTQVAYRRDIEQLLVWSHHNFGELTLVDLQEYVDDLADGGLSAASLARKISSIKGFFQFALSRDHISTNPAAALRAPRVTNQLSDKILTVEEVERILDATTSLRDYALLRYLYVSGSRVSEASELVIRQLTPRDEGGQVTIFGKGAKVRSVKIPSSTWSALRDIVEGRHLDGPVFRSRKGGHLHRSQIHRIIANSAKRAGVLKKVSAHWFRHAHASHALDNGAPPHLVRDSLGHASIATTDRYLHALPNASSSDYLAYGKD